MFIDIADFLMKTQLLQAVQQTAFEHGTQLLGQQRFMLGFQKQIA